MDERSELFETERPRLVGLAARVLGDPAEAEDVVQQSWLRMHRTQDQIDSLPAWLTTVTTRLCLDRLRRRTPEPTEDVDELDAVQADPVDDVVLADTVGIALQVVLDRLTPRERVAFVLHDSFGFDFPAIAAMLDTTTVSARKLASRARAKIKQPASEDRLADWEVVDAFMAAARGGDFDRLLSLLAPDSGVSADAAAVTMGTPASIDGSRAIAEFFNGSAQAALPVSVEDRPGYAWFNKGRAMVLFDFTVRDGQVAGIVFRAEPETLSQVRRRRAGVPHDSQPDRPAAATEGDDQ